MYIRMFSEQYNYGCEKLSKGGGGGGGGGQTNFIDCKRLIISMTKNFKAKLFTFRSTKELLVLISVIYHIRNNQNLLSIIKNWCS